MRRFLRRKMLLSWLRLARLQLYLWFHQQLQPQQWIEAPMFLPWVWIFRRRYCQWHNFEANWILSKIDLFWYFLRRQIFHQEKLQFVSSLTVEGSFSAWYLRCQMDKNDTTVEKKSEIKLTWIQHQNEPKSVLHLFYSFLHQKTLWIFHQYQPSFFKFFQK